MSDQNTNPAPASSTSSSTPPPPPPSSSALARRQAEAEASSTPPAPSSPTNVPPPLEGRAGFLDEEPPAKATGLERSPDVAGAAEVQQRVDAETAQGFIGTKVDPLPDEAYTLATGPDSPRSVEDDHSRVAQHAIDPTITGPSSSSSS